jgi:hypothetical protein
MTPEELEAALQEAFNQCERAACPLSAHQQQILQQSLQGVLNQTVPAPELSGNPLDQLTPAERQTLLAFIAQQEAQQRPWKITLLNDWLQGQDSGAVQFIRDCYGLSWLEQVQPFHLEHYTDHAQGEVLLLKVGDRIEVTNGLWEWVQEEGPCSREWYPCTVVSIREAIDSTEQTSRSQTSCVIRFDTGAEYEIQGVYDWNRPNWRWLQP